MILNIISLIEQRTKYALGLKEGDFLINEVLSDNPETCYFISNPGMFKKSMRLFTELKKYNVAGIFDMGSPFLGSTENWLLYFITKNKINTLKIGEYKPKLDIKRKDYPKNILKGEIATFLNYPREYMEYLEEIENWVNKNIYPKDSNIIKFNEIPFREFSFDYLHPQYYNKERYKILSILAKEKTANLSDIAEIINPKINLKEKSKILTSKSFKYPLDYRILEEGNSTDTPLKKGDIVFGISNFKNSYLVVEDLMDEVYTPKYYVIIRPKNISSEYLISYLQSETSQILMDLIIGKHIIKRITIRDLYNIPIILPKRKDEEYKRFFEIVYLNNKNIDAYNDYFSNYSNVEDIKNGEEILNLELFKKVKLYKEKMIKKIIDDDLKELNSCFKVKAYKATLILAGSILEAVLIDWLSELHGKNYFKVKIKKNYNGKEYDYVLYDYIDAIEVINRPNWMYEADKAHKIREKRNLVHTKLCLESDEINENVCKEVVSYLEDVLKTRVRI